MRARAEKLWATGVAASSGVVLLACGHGASPDHSTLEPAAATATVTTNTATTGPSPEAPSEYFLNGRVEDHPAVAIAGGTLAVTQDGSYAIAADPDRDRLFSVELESLTVSEVAMPDGAELGRIVAGPPGIVYVLGRRSGALYSIDLASASVSQEAHVCAAPRGLAFDSSAALVHVACQGGKLITLDATTFATTRELVVDVDLRDVLVTGGQLLVSRFRSAEVLLLDANGGVVSRTTPDPFPGCAKATALYRMVLSPDQVLYLSHQASSLAELGTTRGGYGNSCSGSSVQPTTSALPMQQLFGWQGATAVDPNAVSEPTRSGIDHAEYDLDITTGAPPLTSNQPTFLSQAGLGTSAGVPFRHLMHRRATGPFDLAVSSQGEVAQLLVGNTWQVASSNLWVGRLGPEVPSTLTGAEDSAIAQLWEVGARLRCFGEPVAVAFTPVGGLIIQSREPATLQLMDGTIVELSEETHANSGHAMFHATVGSGISCASCHPEGTEDGHTWAFRQGLRRTQPLDGGALQRAPFHWNGELESIEALVADVLLSRMGMQELVSVEQAGVLASWLDSIPRVLVEPSRNPAAVNRGEALFHDSEVGCARCHTGPAYADNKAYDVGTGMVLFTPTLLGVGTRRPLMHDGCASTLEERFGLCGGVGDKHGVISHLDDTQRADLVEFMKSL